MMSSTCKAIEQADSNHHLLIHQHAHPPRVRTVITAVRAVVFVRVHTVRHCYEIIPYQTPSALESRFETSLTPAESPIAFLIVARTLSVRFFSSRNPSR